MLGFIPAVRNESPDTPEWQLSSPLFGQLLVNIKQSVEDIVAIPEANPKIKLVDSLAHGAFESTPRHH